MNKTLISIMKKMNVKTIPNALRKFHVKDNSLELSNLDMTLKVNAFHADNGLYDFARYSNTFDLIHARSQLDVSEYPDLDNGFKGIKPKLITNEGNIIIDYLVKLAWYASDDSRSRLSLTGSYLNKKDIVSTDGHKMLKIAHGMELNLPEIDNDNEGIIIPNGKIKKAGMIFKELAKLKNISMYYYPCSAVEWLEFRNPDFSFFMSLIESPYPDYNQVMPDYKSLNSVNYNNNQAKENIKVIKTALTYSDTKAKQIYFKDNKIVTKNCEAENFSTCFTNMFNTHCKLIGFNGSYLLKIFQDIEKEKLPFEYSSSKASTLSANMFQCSNMTYIIMPFKIDEGMGN